MLALTKGEGEPLVFLAFSHVFWYNNITKGRDVMGGNYEKKLFEHLQETLERVDRLSCEVASLKTEHKKEMELLKAENQRLSKENQALKGEVQKLKAMINKNSGNSSKPPSSDGFTKIQNSREKSGKCPGGQPGHKGTTPKLFSKPTRIEDIRTERCRCGGRIVYSGNYTAKQLVDIEIATTIIEYREHKGVCQCCHHHIKNHAPVNDVITYGNSLKSFSAMLSIEGMVSINRIQQMLRELTGGQLNLSEGTIAKWIKDLSKCVVPAIETIKAKLLASPLLHKDETGIRVNKALHWLHVLGNNTCTLYLAHQKRGNDADKEMGILPVYSGILMHDHLRGLYDFTCQHAECNAHILRYLKSAIENKKRKWAQDMITLLLHAKAMSADCRGKSPDAHSIEIIQQQYDEILEFGRLEFLRDEAPDYNGEDMKLLRRLKQYKTEHLRFLCDPTVPFDNNQAERDLRMIKAKSKISGCFRAHDGGQVFAFLKSYTATLRKNKRNIFYGIKAAFDRIPVL